MTQHVLIQGSGKMAIDLAGFFASRGWTVSLRSRSAERAPAIARTLDRIARRVAADADASGPERATPVLSCLSAGAPIPSVDLVLESTVENLAEKRRVVAELAEALDVTVPIASNSSSLLPGTIHPRAMGLHFFYPAFLTRVVEWILPEVVPAAARAALASLLTRLDLDVIEQTEARAFAANRLLLPAQALCARKVLAGVPPSVVDEACIAAGLPRGLLSMMDAIGLDVVLASVESYAERASADDRSELGPLLSLLVACRQSDGTLCSDARDEARSVDPLAEELRACLITTARAFVGRGELSEAELALVTRRVFGIDWKLA